MATFGKQVYHIFVILWFWVPPSQCPVIPSWSQRNITWVGAKRTGVCIMFSLFSHALLCGDLLRKTLVSTAGSSTISPRLELRLEWHCSAWQCVFVFVVLVMHFSWFNMFGSNCHFSSQVEQARLFLALNCAAFVLLWAVHSAPVGGLCIDEKYCKTKILCAHLFNS